MIKFQWKWANKPMVRPVFRCIVSVTAVQRPAFWATTAAVELIVLARKSFGIRRFRFVVNLSFSICNKYKELIWRVDLHQLQHECAFKSAFGKTKHSSTENQNTTFLVALLMEGISLPGKHLVFAFWDPRPCTEAIELFVSKDGFVCEIMTSF